MHASGFQLLFLYIYYIYTMKNKSSLREPVGDFYVHLVRGNSPEDIDADLTPSNAILKNKGGKPTVISFYDGG